MATSRSSVLKLYYNPPPHVRTGMRNLWSAGFRQQRETLFHSSPYVLQALAKNSLGGISLLALSQSDAQEMKEKLREIHKRERSKQKGCEAPGNRLSMDESFDDNDITFDINWKSLWVTLWIILSLL